MHYWAGMRGYLNILVVVVIAKLTSLNLKKKYVIVTGGEQTARATHHISFFPGNSNLKSVDTGAIN